MFLALWAWLAGSAGASPAAVGMLEGVVTSAPHGLALPNVSVTLRSLSGSVSLGSPNFGTQPVLRSVRLAPGLVRTTDRDGAFRFEGLPAGIYSLEARTIGMHPALQPALMSPVIVVAGLVVSENLVMHDAPNLPIPIPMPSVQLPPPPRS